MLDIQLYFQPDPKPGEPAPSDAKAGAAKAGEVKKSPAKATLAWHWAVAPLTDFGIEVPSDTTETLVQLDRVQIARTLVEHVARYGGKPRSIGGIRGGADRQQREKAHQRNGVMLHREHPQTVRKPAAADFRKAEARIGAERREP